MSDTEYTRGFKAGMAWNEDTLLRMAAKHMVRLWWKLEADPAYVLSAVLTDLSPDMDPTEKRAYIKDLVSSEVR